MALNKEKVQDLIDDFVVNNVDQINEVGYENPVLYDAVIDALNLLSRKFGTIQAINIPKPAAPTEPEKPRENALHPSVQIGATFGEAAAIERKYEVEMINFGEELVTFLYNDSHNSIRPIQVKFSRVNKAIEEGEFKLVEKTQPIAQSNTFGALTLNPSVQVGQKYIDLEDDSNFSVLLIDQKKQLVTIYWNEDDVQAEVDFEDFNDNLQAATWVLAPDQAQGTATEAEILDAIEGLELIDDAESKKEITELKKQLKQLKKKKP